MNKLFCFCSGPFFIVYIEAWIIYSACNSNLFKPMYWFHPKMTEKLNIETISHNSANHLIVYNIVSLIIFMDPYYSVIRLKNKKYKDWYSDKQFLIIFIFRCLPEELTYTNPHPGGGNGFKINNIHLRGLAQPPVTQPPAMTQSSGQHIPTSMYCSQQQQQQQQQQQHLPVSNGLHYVDNNHLMHT